MSWCSWTCSRGMHKMSIFFFQINIPTTITSSFYRGNVCLYLSLHFQCLLFTARVNCFVFYCRRVYTYWMWHLLWSWSISDHFEMNVAKTFTVCHSLCQLGTDTIGHSKMCTGLLHKRYAVYIFLKNKTFGGFTLKGFDKYFNTKFSFVWFKNCWWEWSISGDLTIQHNWDFLLSLQKRPSQQVPFKGIQKGAAWQI